jgi:peptide methionine sulfoxide reductase MsrB
MSDAADAKFDRSDEEWKKELAPETFAVMRKHGTERAGTK